jgi:hypothetical protein
MFMTLFTSLVMTIVPHAWRWQTWPFKQHLASIRMRVKHISRVRGIFIGDTWIMTTL